MRPWDSERALLPRDTLQARTGQGGDFGQGCCGGGSGKQRVEGTSPFIGTSERQRCRTCTKIFTAASYVLSLSHRSPAARVVDVCMYVASLLPIPAILSHAPVVHARACLPAHCTPPPFHTIYKSTYSARYGVTTVQLYNDTSLHPSTGRCRPGKVTLPAQHRACALLTATCDAAYLLRSRHILD